MVGAALMLAVPLGAQRAGRPGTGAARVRAEFASVLLQAGRYDEAAREYRVLLARDGDRFEYRLGLARALAWGNHPREAERELSVLARQRAGNASVDSLLRSVRESFEPRAVDASSWVAREPWYQPYRLALARALAREGLSALAIVHFDTLLQRGAGAPDRASLVREMVDAYVAAGNAAAGAARLRAELARSPADTALRHTLAALLATDRRYQDARDEYDALLREVPTAALFRERAAVVLALGDRRAAEADLSSSLAIEPTGDTYLMLGTLYRERGDYRAARAMYDAAAARRERSVKQALAAARAQLAREQRPVVAFAPPLGSDPGWHVAEVASADNQGVFYSALGLSRTFPVASATSLSVGSEYRQLGERANGRAVYASGYGASLGVAQDATAGLLLVRAAATGGAVYHPRSGVLPEGRLGLATWVGAWQLSAEAASRAAYPTLFTAASLLPPDSAGPLVERGVTATLGGPLGALDVALSWQRSRLSDDNSRLTLQGYARYPVAPGLYVVYSATSIAFSRRSALYWDPSKYVAHGAGIEYAVRRHRGLSTAVQLLPGFASSTESQRLRSDAVPSGPPEIGPLQEHRALQLSGSAEASYRASRWEGVAGVSYGRVRAGTYQRFAATLALRFAP